MNNHVNNLKYLQWALETVPDNISEGYFLSKVDIRYLREANYREEIEWCTETNATNNCFKHTIRNLTSGHAYANATSAWLKKQVKYNPR